MRARCLAPFVLAVLAASSADAGIVTFDFAAMGSNNGPSLQIGALTVSADDGANPANVNVVTASGLGVAGGSSSNTIDGAEGVLFAFAGSPAYGVRYSIASATNSNGNGTSGDATVEAFDGNGASLGTKIVNGTGSKDLTLLFGERPLSKFRVRANADGQTIGTVSYNNQIATAFVAFSVLATTTTPSLTTLGVTVTADDGTNPAIVNVLNGSGLGVVGGAINSAVDGKEALTFDFGAARKQLFYAISSAGNMNGNGTSGDCTIQAWNEKGASLGTVATSGTSHSLPALFGNEMMTKFQVRASVDDQTILSVASVPVAGPIIDLMGIPTVVTSRLATGGLIGQASNDGLQAQLAVTLGVGLGVDGGVSSATLDGNEEASFFFDGCAAGAMEFRISAAADLDGNGKTGDGFVEAFDQNGLSQGVVAINGAGVKDLGALFPGPLFSGFTVRANVDAFTLSRIQFTPQPGQFSFPHYGAGCPGGGGLVPRVRVTALTANGGSGVSLAIAHGLAGAPAFVFIGLTRVEQPMGFGCHFYVTPPFGPFGPFALGPSGDFTLQATLPAIPSATTVTVETLIADGGAPGGFSASNGVELNLDP